MVERRFMKNKENPPQGKASSRMSKLPDFCKCGLPRHHAIANLANVPTDVHICRERLGGPLPIAKNKVKHYNGYSQYAKEEGLFLRSEKKN